MKAILLGDAMIPGEGFGKAWEKHLSKYGNDVIVDNWESDWGQLQYRRLEVEKQGPEIETVDETILKEGKDVSIFSTGDILSEAIRAGEILAENGIDAEIIDVPVIKPIDADCIIKSVNKTGIAVTVENHSIIGGLGSAVCEVLSEKSPHKVVRMGINDVFGQSGTPKELIKYYGLDAESIANRIIEMKK